MEAVRPERFQFITAAKAPDYMRILWVLARNRRDHKFEIYYDDALIETLLEVPPTRSTPYDADTFREDVKTLEGWGNLHQRMEPRRIETLGDRRRTRYLIRLDDETVAILEFLQSRAEQTGAFVDRGRHLLQDAAERLAEANKLAVALKDGEGSNDEYLRLAYLIVEANAKVSDASRELVNFDASLVEFARQPFRLEALSDVVDRLQLYVEDYIDRVRENRGLIYANARKLQNAAVLEVLSKANDQVSIAMRANPLAASHHTEPLEDVVQGLTRFFRSHGTFEDLLERVHHAARNVVRRVQSHVEDLRRRNIRIETLRERTREIANLADGQVAAANHWFNDLFASGHVPGDARHGTPAEKAMLPLPAKRHEATRPAYRGSFIEDKTAHVVKARELERERIERVNKFVETKVLQGQVRTSVSRANIERLDDLRLLLDAYKLSRLKGGKNQKALRFRLVFEKNGDPTPFPVEEGTLTVPGTTFQATEAGK